MAGLLTGFSLCVFSLQFGLFSSRQVSGQGVPGLLHPHGHSLRRTPRWGKKLSYTTQILSGCLYLSCFTSPVELLCSYCREGYKIPQNEMPQTTAVALCEKRDIRGNFWKCLSFSKNNNHYPYCGNEKVKSIYHNLH